MCGRQMKRWNFRQHDGFISSACALAFFGVAAVPDLLSGEKRPAGSPSYLVVPFLIIVCFAFSIGFASSGIRRGPLHSKLWAWLTLAFWTCMVLFVLLPAVSGG